MVNQVTQEMIYQTIQEKLEQLKGLKPGTKEHTLVVHDIEKLCRIVDKLPNESLKVKKQGNIIQIVVGVVTVVVPAAVYAILFKKGLRFEQTGVVSSHFFRNLISNVKLKK